MPKLTGDRRHPLPLPKIGRGLQKGLAGILDKIGNKKLCLSFEAIASAPLCAFKMLPPLWKLPALAGFASRRSYFLRVSMPYN